MSARQPFFPARPGSESQGTALDFNQKTFLIDTSNPLHLTSQAASATESTKTAFSVPGPFSNNGANNASQVKTSGLGGLSKKNSLLHSIEKDRKGSFNSLDHGPVRPGTADPRLEARQDRITALEAQHGFSYPKASRRSLMDADSIVRLGTATPQSRALQLEDYAAGLDIRAPIPKSAALSSSAFLPHSTPPDRISQGDAHISTTETKNAAFRKVDDVGDLMFHSSTRGTAFNQTGPQRILIEERFNTPEVDHKHFNASMTSHEVIVDGRLKMSSFGQPKKRNRDEIEKDGDGSYWVEHQDKRHKSSHRGEFETRGYTKSPSYSPRPDSRASHPEGDFRRHPPEAHASPRSPRYRERRPTSPIDERHIPPYKSPVAEQAAPDDTGNTFEKLLGRNPDDFVKQNMEKYDRMVKHWSECPEEEWIAGAEMVTEKYAKLVSYVKNAMLAKINAYASIQVDIDRHFSDLEKRNQLLDASKKKLIMEGGTALV